MFREEIRKAVVLAAILVMTTPALAEAQFLARFTNPKVEVTLTHPPGFPLTLERAAVVPRGDGGCPGELADAVISMFSENGVELLDRENFEAILAEQDLGVSGVVRPETAAEMGKLVGSAILVLVTSHRCAEETKNLTDRFRTFDGKQGVKFIAKTEGFVKGSVRVVDLTSGKIFASQPVEGRWVLQNTSLEGPPEAPSKYDAHDGALRQAVWQVQKMFFPWTERKELYFFNDDECNLRSAFKLLQVDDVDGAAAQSAENLEACKTAAVKPKFVARAYYNLGMARLAQSRYDEALDLLAAAFQRDGGDIIAESIGEARRAKELAEAMARLEDSAELGASPTVAVASRRPEELPASAGADSVESRLHKLDELLKKGLITQGEYDKKRGQILSEI